MSIKHDHTLNPVTALAFYLVPAGRLLILAGEGCYLKVFEAESSKLICQCQVFDDQTIHGISVRDDVQEEGALQVVIWGGCSLTLLRRARFEELLSHNVSSIIDLVILSSDWILDVAISLYDSDNCVLITAHNTVVHAQLPKSSRTAQLETLQSPSRSILYSAQLTWVSPSCILVAAGTVFGEIITWECSLSSAGSCQVLATFTGHEGSIFGVDISPPTLDASGNTTRLLASCSDDRTIRVWDIYGVKSRSPDVQSRGLEAETPRETGFGNNVQDGGNDNTNVDTCLAMVMAHASRIWKVKFHITEPEAAGVPFVEVLSFGEDSTTQVWALDVARHDLDLDQSQPSSLKHLKTFAFHSGKHIWSTATSHPEHSRKLLATGGADGKISFYDFSSSASEIEGTSAYSEGSKTPEASKPQADTRTRRDSWNLDDILPIVTPQPSLEIEGPSAEAPTNLSEDIPVPISVDGKPPKKIKAKKIPKDAFNRYAFVSDREVLLTTTFGRIILLSDVSRSLATREIELPSSGKQDLKSYSVVKGIPELGLALLGGANGNIYLYQAPSRIQLVAQVAGKVADIFAIYDPTTTKLEFLVTTLGANTATLFALDLEQSSLVSTMNSTTLNLPESFVVTSVGKGQRSLAVGSRNGALAIYDLRILDIPLAAWGPEDSSSGDAITSIIFLPNTGQSDKTYLLTTGRNGIYSIFANQTIDDNKEFSVSNLWPVHNGTPPLGPNIEAAWFEGTDLILYGFRSKNFIVWNETKQCEIMNVECGGAHRSYAYSPIPSGGGHFIYTKASKLYLCTQQSPSHCIIKPGGHGREIKACAVSPDKTLMATGAEDTAIRIWTYNESFENKAVIQKHSAGIQALQFHRSEYLFSSGGNEEFFIWALHSIPGVGVGVVCEASYPDQSAERDLRIMSFDVSEFGRDLLISLAFSDSTVRCYRYVTATALGVMSKGAFQIIAKGRYTSSCLMQICHLNISADEIHLLTAATDGNLVVWRAALSSSGEPAQLAQISTHKLHQSSIKCLDLLHNTNDGYIIVATGGDDNALGVTLYASDTLEHIPKSIILRSAHAAAITGLTIVPSASADEGEVKIVSSSNDQRVKEWVVKITSEAERSIGIKNVGDVFTSVADVGDVAVLKDHAEGRKVLVVGNGMEVFSISAGS